MTAHSQTQKQDSFESLLPKYLNDLYGLAMSLTRNSQDAKDLVQETSLKAYKAYDSQFRKGTNLKAWLFTILRNSFINQYRKKSKSPEQVSTDEHGDFSFYSAANRESKQGETLHPNTLDVHKLDDLLGDEVLKAMQSLPDEYREVVYLCDIQEMSYQEIADMLQIPIGTVRSRLARGRGMLNKALWNYAQANGVLRIKKSS